MAIILTKQSGVTPTITAADNILRSGELAYTYSAGDSDGGDRLFIGAGGNKANGFANEVHTLAGKYYTDMMDHPRGSLAPSSAIITDANSKINELFVGDLEIFNGVILSGTGDISLSPFTSNVDVNLSTISNVLDPTSPAQAATKNYVDTLVVTSVNGDVNVSGTGNVVTGEGINIAGGHNINTTRVDLANQVKLTVNLDSDITGLSSLNIDNVNIDGNTISTTSGNLYIDPADPGVTGTVIIAGNLQVDGTTTTINSTTLAIEDKNITLALGAASAAAADSAGIHVEGADADIYYRASDDKWIFNKDISAPNLNISGGLSTNTLTGKYLGFDSDLAASTTDGLPEGSTNLYYTTARADSDAKNAIAVSNASGDGSIAYDASSGLIEYTGPSAAEVRSHFSAGGDMIYDSATGRFSIDVEVTYTKQNFDSDLGLANTGQLPEGSNLYFTNERVDDRIYNLLHAGEGIDLEYNDAGNELDISVELASTHNPGIATFDSQDFLVTAGNVEINTIDCGTY